MGKTITNLKTQKRDRERVSVYLDGNFAFGLPLLEAARLKVGQVLSEEEIAELKHRDAIQRAAHRAMNLLSYRPRSRNEVRRRLRRKDYTEEVIEEAIGRLERAGLLDDRAFARYWIENRFRFNPRGRAILRQELRQKGVGDRVIEEALTGYDEQTAAEEAAAKAVRRLRRFDNPTFRRKLIGYLRRRGFFYDTIQPIVEELVVERASEEIWEENEE